MKKTLLKLGFLLVSTISIAQSNISVDTKSPEIKITDWVLNKPNDTDLDGKYIVLEFWATWCGPCIAAVPHMNQLQKEIKHPDLFFISITDESVEKIKRTLDKVNFTSSVVTDITKQTQINFGDGTKGLDAYPMTVLINNEGILKWIGEPNQLSVEILRKFLDNNLESINHFEEIEKEDSKQKILVEKESQSMQTVQDEFLSIVKDKNVKMYINLRQTNTTEVNSLKIGNMAVLMSPVTIKEIYKEVFNIRIESSELVDSVKYTLLYKNKKDKGDSFQQLEEMILGALGLNHQAKVEEVSKYSIQINDDSLLKPTLENMFSSKSGADSQIIFTNYSIFAMIEEMSNSLNINCEYKGENQVKYDFLIHSNNFKDFKLSLESYGLSIHENTEKETLHYLIEKE